MIKALALFVGSVVAQPAIPTFTAGRAAYEQNRVAEAEAIYKAVADDPSSSPGDRARSSVELARIAWLIDGDSNRALAHVRAAASLSAIPCEVAQMEARVLREAHRGKILDAHVPQLLARCRDPIKTDKVRIVLIQDALDRAALLPAQRARLHATARRELSRLTPDGASMAEAATARLELALLDRNAAGATRAWRDFFWLADGDDGPPALRAATPARTIDAGLSPRADDHAKVNLAYLLMKAGFADSAARFAAAERLPGKATTPQWLMLVAYWKQRGALVATATKLNRALARGGSKDDPMLDKAAGIGLGTLMAAAGATSDPKKALADKYGLLGSVGKTSGYPSIHAGHLVDDRSETVRQYGREATIRFATIDNMWGNGFESWLWDGSAMSGGWSGDGTIVHVRPAYTGSPQAAFGLVGDTTVRREILARQAQYDAEDTRNARDPLNGTLSGLGDRLRLQLVDQIAETARHKGGDFRRAFLDEYWRANLQQSIFVHEGRHAIDQKMAADPAKLDSEALEYTAKLSELALSDYPRLALWNLNRGVGGSSPHDRAGTRILNAFARWVDTHRAEVGGHDAARPPAVQIDKLTDGQIREIAMSLDPLAGSKP